MVCRHLDQVEERERVGRTEKCSGGRGGLLQTALGPVLCGCHSGQQGNKHLTYLGDQSLHVQVLYRYDQFSGKSHLGNNILKCLLIALCLYIAEMRGIINVVLLVIGINTILSLSLPVYEGDIYLSQGNTLNFFLRR